MTIITVVQIGVTMFALGFGIGCLWGARSKAMDPQEGERWAPEGECLEADAIHGDVPALRRGEVVHDYTEAVR